MFPKASLIFSLASLLLVTSSASAHEGSGSGYDYNYDNNYHARTFDIVVGGDAGLVYTPPVVYPEVGDTLRFWFRAKNHTVTQSSFEHPCTPLEDGFTSGFRPVSPDQKDHFPYFDVEVKDKKPIWVHCEQVNHCPSGMVFAANPALEGDKTFANFLANAKAVGTSAPAPQPTGTHGYSAKFRRATN
ncbi:hypothetical protein FRB99_003333 [Tulasnella sp. 403]|nr:hypothetical protein FRB99_003333 [Tulasnella sp. 403]